MNLNTKKVYRALRLLPLLNPEARDLIGKNAGVSTGSEGSIPADGGNSTKKKWQFSDLAAFQLTVRPDIGFKPGVRKKAPAEGAETQKLWPYPPISPKP